MQGPTKSTGRALGVKMRGAMQCISAYDMYPPQEVPTENEEAQRKGPQASAAHW
jgi:hypothetical protein